MVGFFAAILIASHVRHTLTPYSQSSFLTLELILAGVGVVDRRNRGDPAAAAALELQRPGQTAFAAAFAAPAVATASTATTCTASPRGRAWTTSPRRAPSA